MNVNIAKFEKVAERSGKESAIQRANSFLCSFYLGRGFGESGEEFLAKHPDMVEFQNWLQEFSK